MFRLRFSRFFSVSAQFRNLTNVDKNLDKILSHVYQKTWTKNQLIEYIKDNVVYESDQYFVTGLPQGVALNKNSQWADSVNPLLCEADLKEIMKELPSFFKSESAFLTVYPRSNSSGLTIFSKSYEAHRYIKKNLIMAASKKEYSFKFLAVVLGCPDQSLRETLGIQLIKIGEKYATQVVQNLKSSDKFRKVWYKHKVLVSSNLASLVEIEVMQDIRNCVRHVLGSRCLTPVLGDIWYCLKNLSTFQGAHFVFDPVFVNQDYLKLDPELLAKLNLKPGEESIIPIHCHLYSLKVKLKSKSELFLSASPPESFIWTCKQLGFNEITNYVKVTE